MARLREYKPLDVRVTEDKIIEKTIKYYLAFEGSNTEKDYFQCIKNNSKNIGLSNYIEIVVLEKDESIAHNSAPIRVLEEIKKKKKELIEDGEFKEEIDKFVLVFDRDSFKPVDSKREKYREFLNIAKDETVLAVTSPCFEIWLLLHYDNIVIDGFNNLNEEMRILDGLDKYKEEFRQNTKVSGKHTFTSKIFSSTSGINPKSGTDFSEMISNIDNAIERERNVKLTQDIFEMADMIGSNIGEFIELLRKDPRENAD